MIKLKMIKRRRKNPNTKRKEKTPTVILIDLLNKNSKKLLILFAYLNY